MIRDRLEPKKEKKPSDVSPADNMKTHYMGLSQGSSTKLKKACILVIFTSVAKYDRYHKSVILASPLAYSTYRFSERMCYRIGDVKVV